MPVLPPVTTASFPFMEILLSFEKTRSSLFGRKPHHATRLHGT
jgi:hypothetical protein